MNQHLEEEFNMSKRKTKKVDERPKLTEEQQNELATYRQALLDLPSDYDDPHEAMANLPTIPSWLD